MGSKTKFKASEEFHKPSGRSFLDDWFWHGSTRCIWLHKLLQRFGGQLHQGWRGWTATNWTGFASWGARGTAFPFPLHWRPSPWWWWPRLPPGQRKGNQRIVFPSSVIKTQIQLLSTDYDDLTSLGSLTEPSLWCPFPSYPRQPSSEKLASPVQSTGNGTNTSLSPTIYVPSGSVFCGVKYCVQCCCICMWFLEEVFTLVITAFL